MAGAAAGLDAVDEQLVELVARLPLAPVAVVASFLTGGTSTAHRRISNLLDHGLLRALVTPLRTTGRPARLLCLTEFGLAVLARRRATEPSALARQLGMNRTRAARLLAELPGLLAAYELLTLIAAAHAGSATLSAWERPWRRKIAPREGRARRAPRVVRLPAAATLTWSSPGETVAGEYVLVPDTGGLALPALQASLGRLVDYQATSSEPSATLIIATTTPRRATAWTRLLDAVCNKRGAHALAARVALWDDFRWPVQGRCSAVARPTLGGNQTVVRVLGSDGQADSLAHERGPAALRFDRVLRGGPAHRMMPVVRPLDRMVLDLVGRHPFLSTNSLAALLGRDASWVRTRKMTLVARGLLRVVPAEEVNPPELARRELLELTRPGLEVLGAHLGLPLGVAVRHHGLAGGGPTRPVGQRPQLLAHLAHTLGADAVFASVARATAVHPSGGALEEWRAAATCAHGRFRPDGYGLLRLGRQLHGFFLEFDRGNMRPARLRAKFAAYHRYRGSQHAARSFAGFPTLLVVTIGPGAEQRLARALQAADTGQGSPLSALLTTTSLLESSGDGPLGAVWRMASETTRRRAWA